MTKSGQELLHYNPYQQLYDLNYYTWTSLEVPIFREPRGSKYVLVMVDHFTRYAVAVPIRDKTAETTANALKEPLDLQIRNSDAHSDGSRG